MASSPKLAAPQPPPAFDATPTSLIEDVKRIIEISRKVVDDIIANIDPDEATFENVILPFINDENSKSRETRILKFYASTSPRKELRDASNTASKLLTNAEIDFLTREDFYELVNGVVKRREKLSSDSQYFLEKLHQSFQQNGLKIPNGPDRERYKEIQKRIGDLTRECLRNLNGDTSGLWFTRGELEGLPNDFVKHCRTEALAFEPDDALSVDYEAKGEGSSRLWVTFKDPDTIPIMKFAANPETRRKEFIANQSRCPQNGPLYREVFILRDEAARLMGYPNHAAFRTESKMVKTPDVVNVFLGDVRTQLKTRRDEEIDILLQLKREDLEARGEQVPENEQLYLWDRVYYDRILKEKYHSFNQNEIAEYFSLDKTLSGMFKIYSHIFGLQFVEVPAGKSARWHESVTMFTVWDQDNRNDFLGYLYFDFFPRDGKYTHAGHYNLQPGYFSASGERHYPSSALVMNFPTPTATKPSLLKHEELRRLFHELGHGIHSLVSKTRYSRFHGTSVDRDFVEAPSMMFENFFWTARHMKELSYHYSYLSPEYLTSWKASWSQEEKERAEVVQPPLQIPEGVIQNLVKTKHINGALLNLLKTFQSMFDMAVHGAQTHEWVENVDLQVLFNKMRAEITGLAGPEVDGEGYAWGNGYAVFRAIVGKYDAGYYTYLLSQIYSSDLFYTGFRGDTMNEEKGRRYRYTVLEPGGSQPELQTLRNFLGREPNTKAFCEEHGLSM